MWSEGHADAPYTIDKSDFSKSCKKPSSTLCDDGYLLLSVE
jgi:hypothetical protein